MQKFLIRWLQNLNDTIAIQSQAKTDLVYVQANLAATQVSQLSFQYNQLFLSCAFNETACST